MKRKEKGGLFHVFARSSARWCLVGLAVPARPTGSPESSPARHQLALLLAKAWKKSPFFLPFREEVY